MKRVNEVDMEHKGKDELERLCEECDLVKMLPDGEDVILEVCAWSAVICEIRLLGVCSFQLLPEGCFTEMRSFTVLEDGYRLCFYNMNADEDQEISFVQIEYRCEPCNALFERIDSYTRLQTPWEYLGLVARGICCHIEYDVANEAELEIRALAEFLEILQGDWETQKLPQADWADEMMQTAWTQATSQAKHPDDVEWRPVNQVGAEERQGNQADVVCRSMHQEGEVPRNGTQADVAMKWIPGIFWNCAVECGISEVTEQYASGYGKLFRELSKEKYEPFWRRIYQLLADTQDGIPSHAQRCCRKEDLRIHQEYVSQQMKKYGFEGEYPCFYAKGGWKGPSLFFSYENTHIAFREKEAESFIVCRQQDDKGKIETELFCGVIFHPGEEDDIFSCMFDSHGKSYFSCFTTWHSDVADDEFAVESPDVMKNDGDSAMDGVTAMKNDGDSAMDGVTAMKNDGKATIDNADVPWLGDRITAIDRDRCGTICAAAAKSAHLSHLTKEEYAYKHTARVWSSKGFYITYLLAGLVMFGALMTAGFAALEAVLVFLLTQSGADVAECFRATPWGMLFVAAGTLYACPMTLCMYLAMRK